MTNADTSPETTTTLQDSDGDLWHLDENGLWNTTGSNEDLLTREELDDRFGPLTEA